MSNIKLFESKQIRTVWNEAEQKWYFVVADVVQVLTDTPNPTDYIKKMRKRDELLSQGWGQLVTPPFGRYRRRQTKTELCQCTRTFANHSIHSIT